MTSNNSLSGKIKYKQMRAEPAGVFDPPKLAATDNQLHVVAVAVINADAGCVKMQ